MSVRSVIVGEPEHVEAAAPLVVFSSYAAGVGQRPGRFQRSDRSLKGVRSVLPLRNLEPKGEGIRDYLLFL